MDNIRIELNNGGLYFRGNFKEKVKSETVKDVEWNFEDAVQHLANSFDFMEIRGNEISHIESDNTIVCSDRDVNYTYWNHGIFSRTPSI